MYFYNGADGIYNNGLVDLAGGDVVVTGQLDAEVSGQRSLT
jgi:hypothetical protein